MSTGIEPGQVWASMRNAAETATVREVRGNEVWATDDQSGSHFVRASLGFRCDYELVKDAPAPLDPSKVKAGDTVTVEVLTKDGAKADLTGEVRGTGYNLWVGPISITSPADDITRITLTAHQPAPEPEPVYEDGAVIRTAFSEYHMIMGEFVDIHDGGALAGNPDVRPLVVIDPAEARESLKVAGYDESTILSVSLLLGFEAP